MGVDEVTMREGLDLHPAASVTSSEPSIDALLQWFKTEHHGQIHKALEIYRSEETGLSFRTSVTGNATIAAGEPVVVCPLSASLSYLNVLGHGRPLGKGLQSPEDLPEDSQLAFSSEFVKKVPPHVVGRFFLIKQFLLGTSSPWAPYISTLPAPHDYDAWALPAVWHGGGCDTTALDLLKSTNAEVAAAEMRKRIDDEFREAWPLLQDDDSKEKYTLSLYEWAYCIFTSRSFRPSLVLTEVIKDALCCGLDVEEHYLSMINHVWLPMRVHTDDFSMLLPVLDIGNHDPRAVVQWQPVMDASREAISSSTALTSIPSTKTDHAIVFSTDTAHSSGQPVFNNYGSKTNSELLVGYGFVLAPTPDMHNDYVHLRKRGEPGPFVSDIDTAAGTKVDAYHRDYLLSLRPMAEPTSPVGRARLAPEQWIDDHPLSTRRSPGAALVDDGLLWDMLVDILEPDYFDLVENYVLAQIMAESENNTAPEDVPLERLSDAILDLVFGTQSPPDTLKFLQNVRSEIFATMVFKLVGDLDDLDALDLETFSPKNRHERVALQYRKQYYAVVDNAFGDLGCEVEFDDEEDDDQQKGL
ncbi:hypothetical protein SEPCBS57363_006357 [Sporothrix epigloea]|uniref:SET domain-containing protein n=1 Tax=Sporothrix epigloea TaxID=1892477 RepID=A0ABP0E5Y3_9PEZI